MFTTDVKAIIKGNIQKFIDELEIKDNRIFSLGKLEEILDIKDEEKLFEKRSDSEISIEFLCDYDVLFQNVEKIYQIAKKYNLETEFYYRAFIYPETIIIYEIVDVKNKKVIPHIYIEEFVEMLYRADRDTIEDVAFTIDSIFKKHCCNKSL